MRNRSLCGWGLVVPGKGQPGLTRTCWFSGDLKDESSEDTARLGVPSLPDPSCSPQRSFLPGVTRDSSPSGWPSSLTFLPTVPTGIASGSSSCAA